MIVREFQKEDFPRLLVLAEQMHQESPHFRRLQMINEKLIELGETIIQRPDIMCGLVAVEFVSPSDGSGIHGFIMGVISEYWFSRQKTACDLGLYVTPEKRGGQAAVRLVRGYERWAWNHGAVEASLGITTGIHMQRTAKLYKKMGFHKAGILCKKMRGD